MTFDGRRMQQLQTAMAAWIAARSLSRTEFGRQLVGGSSNDAVIDGLRAAAEAVRTATTHQDLGDAATYLAAAMQGIGLSKWPGFLRDASERASGFTPPAGDRVFAQLATGTATDASSAPLPRQRLARLMWRAIPNNGLDAHRLARESACHWCSRRRERRSHGIGCGVNW